MNAPNPRPRFGPSIPVLFALAGDGRSLGQAKDGLLAVLSSGRKVEAVAVDPEPRDSVAMPIDRNLADETIAYYQTAARAYRQGALRDPSFAARHP